MTKTSNKRAKLYGQTAFLLFLIVGTVLIIRHQHNAPYQHNTGMIFGTVYNVTYQNNSDLGTGILSTLHQVDSSLSMFNERSTISRINRGEQVKLDKMFIEVFDLAEEVSEKTDGAFDITVAPLVNAWGFGFKKGIAPTQHEIDSLLEITNYKKVQRITERGASLVRKADPHMMLDCSAIAKGYGADAVAAYLVSAGVKNYMVEIGGEVVTQGVSPKRLPWKIGVTKPTDDSLCVNQELQTVLNVTDMAMATSGNYRNFYYKNGKKYAHTIDPKTGYPVQHSLLSSTVLAKRCAKADAFATAFMVMGIEKAKKVLSENPDLMAYFIYSDSHGELKVWHSPSMKGKIVDE